MTGEWWLILTSTIVATLLGAALLGVFLLLGRIRQRSRQAREQLQRESERKFQTFFNTVSDCIYFHTPEGILLEVNESAAQLFGRSASALQGRHLGSLFEKRREPDVEGYLVRLRSTMKVIQGVFSIRREDAGRVTVIEYRSTPVVEDGVLVRVQGIARDITERTGYERSLRKSERRMKHLLDRATEMRRNLELVSRETMRVQEEERVKVSRELHDEIGQLLATIRLNLRLLINATNGHDPDVSRKLADTEQLAGEMFGRIRQFLRELRPTGLDEHGLTAAVRRFTQSAADAAKVRIALSGDLDAFDTIAGEKRTIVYRVIQESITNVMKHAQATDVTIAVERLEGGLALEVCDNGVGFDPPPGAGGPNARRGIGLLGMEERVRLIGGSLDIRSTPGAGTVVSVVIPAEKHASPPLHPQQSNGG